VPHCKNDGPSAPCLKRVFRKSSGLQPSPQPLSQPHARTPGRGERARSGNVAICRRAGSHKRDDCCRGEATVAPRKPRLGRRGGGDCGRAGQQEDVEPGPVGTRRSLSPRRLNGSGRGFCPPTRRLDGPAHGFCFTTRGLNVATHQLNVSTRGFFVVTRRLNVSTHGFCLTTRGFCVTTGGPNRPGGELRASTRRSRMWTAGANRPTRGFCVSSRGLAGRIRGWSEPAGFPWDRWRLAGIHKHWAEGPSFLQCGAHCRPYRADSPDKPAGRQRSQGKRALARLNPKSEDV
jgi:hypothetical protein